MTDQVQSATAGAERSVRVEPDGVSPLEAFTGEIARPKVSLLYRAGLAVVAFAMVLLPAVYILLIGLVAWLVLLHLTHDFGIMEGSGSPIGRVMLYVGPAVVGGIIVFFMLKPLFSRRAKRIEPLSLDPAAEPLLFAFVQKVCQLVHAPMPSRIDVDCQVNASASLRRGFWSRDLVLTIGLPLAAGLDMRQFAGVLAHEFGHFSQGAGMRLTYVIRYINFWFARVVFERDKWDQQLEASARRTDFRIAIVLHATRGAVWLTRRILWVLMHAGHGISCFMLRQMEYDADNYESKIAGSDAFESTATRIRELNAASAIAFENVRQSWASHRLPENLPLLIQHKTGALPDELRQKLTETAATGKTRWFDTHPCDADRVRATKALNEAGVFRLEVPATALFADFAATSKLVSHHQYAKHWSMEFSDQNLVASDQMLQESAASSDADAAVRHFYGDVNVAMLPLLLGGEFPPLLDRESAMIQWRQAREQAAILRADAAKTSVICAEKQKQFMNSVVALNLTAANFKINPKEFGLPEKATTPANQNTAAQFSFDESAGEISLQLKKMEPFMAALRDRVTFAVRLARPPAVGGVELETVAQALAAAGSRLAELHQLGARLQAFMLLAQNRGNHQRPAQVDAVLTSVAGELRGLTGTIQRPFGAQRYPFPHPSGELTIIEYARYEKPCQSEFEKTYREAATHVERLFALHYRLLGCLLVMVEASERELEKGQM